MNPDLMMDFERNNRASTSNGPNEQDDSLDSFTSSILSQYASGLNPPICKVTNAEPDPGIQGDKLLFAGFSAPGDKNRDLSPEDLGSLNNYLNKIEILYTMSSRLESVWNDLAGSVKDRTAYSRYDLAVRKPPVWKQTSSLNDLQLESISRWIETSANVLCCLAHTLNVDSHNMLETSGSKLLQDAIDEAYSKFGSDFSKMWDLDKSGSQNDQNDLKNKYLKIMKFNTRLQSDYERMLEKLRSERDAALAKAEQKTILEKEIATLKGKISNLEKQLEKKGYEIEELNANLESSSRVHLQIMKRNEELVASNQKLLMDKSNFIDKETAKQLIKQYYEEEVRVFSHKFIQKRGGERKDDIVQLLERMLDINTKSKRSESIQPETRRSLLNEFMDFVNDNVD